MQTDQETEIYLDENEICALVQEKFKEALDKHSVTTTGSMYYNDDTDTYRFVFTTKGIYIPPKSA
jgi:hypothetical protein